MVSAPKIDPVATTGVAGRTGSGRRGGGPGWGGLALRFGFLAYVFALVVLPLAMLVVHGLAGGPSAAWSAMMDDAAFAALALTLGCAGVTTVVNAIVGLGLAWALVRWTFPGRSLLARLVDLPLAVPTLVAGVLVVALYGPQTLVGGGLEEVGVSVVFAKPAILLVLLFVTLPLSVRAVTPVLLELDPAEEEAATTLGAGRLQTMRWVVLPALLPGVAVGAVQVFARCVAEFGAVATVSGNIPFETLTAPVYILGEVEAGRTEQAAAVSLVLLGVAVLVQPVTRLLAGRVS